MLAIDTAAIGAVVGGIIPELSECKLLQGPSIDIDVVINLRENL